MHQSPAMPILAGLCNQFQQVMENNNKQSNDQEKKSYQVTPMGSLGLLAIGYKGLYAWRAAKKEFLKNREEQKNEQKKG